MMTKVKRRLFFYVLALIFIIISPIIVGYALGFKFYLFERKIEATGAIFIKSKIPRLEIFLNNKPIKETSFFTGGALITELKPVTYLLRIEKSGFHPISKTVVVEPMLVAELLNILPIPNPLIHATATAREIELIFEANATDGNAAQNISKKINLGVNGKLLQRGATTTEILASNVRAFFEISENTLISINKNGFISKLDVETDTQEIIGRPGMFLGAGEFKFFKTASKNIFILDPSGGLFWINPEDGLRAIDGGIKDVKFDENHKKALLIKDAELEVLWLDKNKYQPFQVKGDRELIFRSGENIDSAEWFYGDNAHIVMKTRNGIYLTELDIRGGRSTIELINERVTDLFVTPEIKNSIFFKKGKTWYRIEL